jgi:hypothetical protein
VPPFDAVKVMTQLPPWPDCATPTTVKFFELTELLHDAVQRLLCAIVDGEPE